MFKSLCAALVVGAFILAPASLAQARSAKSSRKKKCKRTERYVEANTPVLGGPGLGFETIYVPKASACLLTVSTTDDGSFVMIRFETKSKDKKGKPVAVERAGWVATGLVDEKLSDLGGAAVVPAVEGETRNVFTGKESVLLSAPRFDAKVVGPPIPGGTQLKVTGTSSDGQWLRVVAEGTEGFIAKYAVSEQALTEGAAPTAGSGTWSAPREGRVPYADSAAAARAKAGAATPKDPKKPAEAGAKNAGKKPSGDAKGAVKAKDGAETKDVAKPEGAKDATAAKPGEVGPEGGALSAAPPAGPLLGRTQEVGVNVHYMFWHERYASDATLDPFAAYALNAFVGGGAQGHYMYRGDFPIVAGFSGHFDVSGFSVGDPATGQPTTAVNLQMGLQPKLGWRFAGSPDIDIEAGGVLNADGYFTLGGPTDYITSTNAAFYQAGPWISARARLLGGKLGFLGVDASLLVGGYSMLSFPESYYEELVTEGKGVDEDGNPICTQGFQLPAKPEGDKFDAYEGQRHEGCPNKISAAPPVHLGIGTDIAFRYGYPVLDFLRLDAVGRLRLRHANIRGGGVKNVVFDAVNELNSGAYSEATNLDVSLSVGVGATFTF